MGRVGDDLGMLDAGDTKPVTPPLRRKPKFAPELEDRLNFLERTFPAPQATFSCSATAGGSRLSTGRSRFSDSRGGDSLGGRSIPGTGYSQRSIPGTGYSHRSTSSLAASVRSAPRGSTALS